MYRSIFTYPKKSNETYCPFNFFYELFSSFRTGTSVSDTEASRNKIYK